MRIEHTEAGPQIVIDDTPPRTIPAGPLKPRRKQTDKLMELEKPVIEAQQGKLF